MDVSDTMNWYHDNVNYLHWHAFPDTIVTVGLILVGLGFIWFCWACEFDD